MVNPDRAFGVPWCLASPASGCQNPIMTFSETPSTSKENGDHDREEEE
jgi:hypothetical protein